MRFYVVAGMLAALAAPAAAQDIGTLNPHPLPPLAHPEDPATPAKQLFGRKTTPTTGASEVIGFYSKGCMAGAKPVPMDGEAWQVMRPSRNRNWGQPQMVSFVERMASRMRQEGVWPGFLVGDMAQPRGGPMITGHASHQIGLDADIWMTPMPSHTLSRTEREEMSSTNVVRADGLEVDTTKWTPAHMAMLKEVASQPEVERIFVNAAIKKAICRDARGDRSWLSKMRPMYEHNYHFHIRIACPAGQASCVHQDPTPPGDSCDASLAWWFKDSVLHPKPDPNAKPRPPITLAGLPADCRAVLNAP
jgi:penicillin-insensitive murein endopeptidase